MQGIQNLGSTCAVNSLIQIICRTPYLRNIFLNNDVPDNSMSSELKEILTLLYTQNHSISPKKFINRLYIELEGIFIRGEQIDISELWFFLFDKLAIELSIDNNKTFDDTNNNDEIYIKYLDTMNRINNNKSSILYDTCQGVFLNCLKCNKCENILYNFEPFISIPLDLPDDDNIPTVGTLLRNYLKSQEQCGDWKCDKCNEYTKYTKSTKIWKTPKVLFFIIKRFINITQKNNKLICINKCFKIAKGTVINDIETDYIYDISSLGLHFGNIGGGHYSALCKDNDNKEQPKNIIYDDLSVFEIDKEKFTKLLEANNNAYLIVYTLKQ